jgi:hypothetical protein
MAPTAAQFSPGQILEAGRRAENDGRVGYAIQFYRHLTDHHGWSPEAAIAKEALARLANFRPPNDMAPQGAVPMSGAAQHPPIALHAHAPHAQVQPQSPQWGAPQHSHGIESNGGQSHRNPQPVVQLAARAQYPGPQSQPAAQSGAHAIAGLPSLRLPAATRRYRIGSALAWLLFGVGLLMIAVSFVLLGLHSVGIKVPGTLGAMLGFTGGLPGALAILTVGVGQVFAAQIGRAVFDHANAMRDLVMIERAKIAHAAGEQPFNGDDDEPA